MCSYQHSVLPFFLWLLSRVLQAWGAVVKVLAIVQLAGVLESLAESS
jgi:hypothetical protein